MLFGLVAWDNDSAIDSIDLVEVVPTLLGRPASFQQDRSQDERP
jgi:hypothetical protein